MHYLRSVPVPTRTESSGVPQTEGLGIRVLAVDHLTRSTTPPGLVETSPSTLVTTKNESGSLRMSTPIILIQKNVSIPNKGVTETLFVRRN